MFLIETDVGRMRRLIQLGNKLPKVEACSFRILKMVEIGVTVSAGKQNAFVPM
jgi:hypothetical protein